MIANTKTDSNVDHRAIRSWALDVDSRHRILEGNLHSTFLWGAAEPPGDGKAHAEGNLNTGVFTAILQSILENPTATAGEMKIVLLLFFRSVKGQQMTGAPPPGPKLRSLVKALGRSSLRVRVGRQRDPIKGRRSCSMPHMLPKSSQARHFVLVEA